MDADALSRPSLSPTKCFDTADEHMRLELGKWLAIVASSAALADIIQGACNALSAGCQLGAIRCPSCHALHVGMDKLAACKHIEHVCTEVGCGQKILVRPA